MELHDLDDFEERINVQRVAVRVESVRSSIDQQVTAAMNHQKDDEEDRCLEYRIARIEREYRFERCN